MVNCVLPDIGEGEDSEPSNREIDAETVEDRRVEETDVGAWEISTEAWRGIAVLGGALVLQGLATAYLLVTMASVTLFLLVVAYVIGFFALAARLHDWSAIGLLVGAISTGVVAFYFLATVPNGRITLTTSAPSLWIVVGIVAAGAVLLALGVVQTSRLGSRVVADSD